jgi:hypothetical protein
VGGVLVPSVTRYQGWPTSKHDGSVKSVRPHVRSPVELCAHVVGRNNRDAVRVGQQEVHPVVKSKGWWAKQLAPSNPYVGPEPFTGASRPAGARGIRATPGIV